MNIVHLVDYFHPDMGYQENHLARIQNNRGHTVHVVTGNRFGVWGTPPPPDFRDAVQRGDRNLRDRGISVHRLAARFEYSHRLWLHGLCRTLSGIEPDLVHVHGYFTLNALRTANLKHRLKFRLVIDDHMLFVASQNPFSTFANRIFRNFFSPFVQRTADKLVAVSGETREFMHRVYGIPLEKIEIIPLGVDRGIFRQSGDRVQDLKKELALDDAPVLLYTGKCNDEKAPARLLEACLPLWKKGGNFTFLIVGTCASGYAEILDTVIDKHGLGGRVRRVPAVPTNRLADYFNLAFAAAWPRQSSMSSLEAMACGCPVILSDTPVNRERVRNGSGLLFPESDLEALAGRIERLLFDPAAREAASKKALEAVCDLDWEQICDRFLEPFTEKRALSHK
jgi:glycosyltransferase involved in cell wall biosynthesis